jgi:hypothetical protein
MSDALLGYACPRLNAYALSSFNDNDREYAAPH